MAAPVFPLGDFVNDEWYPGYRPAYGEAPAATDPIRTFSAEDEARFWFLDFHWPRGFTPLGFTVPQDCHAWGTQVAADNLPLPPGRGLTGRIAGTHIYDSDVPVASEWEMGKRGMLLGQNLPPILANFSAIWEARKAEVVFNTDYFEALTFAGESPTEIGVHLVEARNFQRRAMEIHFELMYPLLANYLGFYGVCAEFGIDAGQISKFLQGDDTKIMANDRAMWDLAATAGSAGLEGVFAANEPEGLAAALAATPGAGEWRSKLDAYLAEYGWRTPGIMDPNLAPWIEDPTPVYGTVKTFLTQAPHDFEAGRAASLAERDGAIDAARSKLTVEQQGAFDGALGSCQAANFAWWNEEHNHYIDQRISIPIRRSAMALAQALGADSTDDAQYCFYPELMELARGQRQWASMKNVVTERRDYYNMWLARRPEMPKVLGTVPAGVPDPIAVEIFGMHHHFFEGLSAGADGGPIVLKGVPASAGTARGRARVLHDAMQLHKLEPGEILVCEATSPSWTPAFAKIAACVCDGGGTLTHASIVSREYRIPCVVGVGRATGLIKTGDEVEVDGTTGTVRVVG